MIISSASAEILHRKIYLNDRVEKKACVPESGDGRILHFLEEVSPQ